MLPISNANSATALLVLRQTDAMSPFRNTVAGRLEASANGILQADESGAGRVSIDAQGKITESLFSVQTVDVTKLKVNLMERLGQELGLDMDEFETASEFGRAVKRAIDAIKTQDDGAQRLAEIERKLELGKLGISLDDLVAALNDPDGEADNKLDAALMKMATERDEDASGPARLYDL